MLFIELFRFVGYCDITEPDQPPITSCYIQSSKAMFGKGAPTVVVLPKLVIFYQDHKKLRQFLREKKKTSDIICLL